MSVVNFDNLGLKKKVFSNIILFLMSNLLFAKHCDEFITYIVSVKFNIYFLLADVFVVFKQLIQYFFIFKLFKC